MNKFYCGPRHTLSIVYYVASSMGYSTEETKRIVGKIENDKEMNEFQKILTEPFYSMQNVEFNGERMDIIEPFNLAERIQMVVDLILKKSDSKSEGIDKVTNTYLKSPFRFSNFIRNPKDEPKMTAREEYLRDEAEIEKFDEERLEMLKEHDKQHELLESIDGTVRKAMDETLREFKDKLDLERWKEVLEEEPVRINGGGYFKSQLNMFGRPNSQMPRQWRSNLVPEPSFLSSKHIVNEIDEINQVIDSLIGFRDRLIAKLGYDQFKEKEPQEQPKFNWDDVQKAQESPAEFESVKFTEDQRQRQREILGNQFDYKSRYDKIANEKVRKLSEYSIRHSSKHLFDKTLRNRTEEEAMISRSIEIYPSANLCKDSLDVNNLKELFSFVRVDGDRLYHINDSSVQPWDRNKPLGSIQLVKEDLGFFNGIKFIVKVNEDNIEEYVDKYFDNAFVILDAVNDKYGLSITPEDIRADRRFETPNQYLLRCSYYRVADEVKESLKEDRIKLIKRLVRDSAVTAMSDRELNDWVKGKNPTNN